MPSLPPIDTKANANHAPHVFILGAGASVAAFPNGDCNGKRLPLMSNFVEVVGLKPVVEKYGVVEEIHNFESFYDDLVVSANKPELLKEIEQKTRDYFGSMKLPNEATLYDQIILSLREKDLIATFNWDPFLAQAYRRNSHLKNLPEIRFLHGNVEVAICPAHLKKGWAFQKCSECGTPMEPSKLLFPVKQKNYNEDVFIKNEWDVLRWYLQRAYFVTIFGYSAPVTDIEARKLMLDEWRENQTRDFAEIEIIDVKPRGEIEDSWKDFFVRYNYSVMKDAFNSQSFRYTRRSCDAHAMATLQQSPWPENPFPHTTNLTNLQNWVRPLIMEEDGGRFSGKRSPPCKIDA
jgi:hypothetical protein